MPVCKSPASSCFLARCCCPGCPHCHSRCHTHCCSHCCSTRPSWRPILGTVSYDNPCLKTNHRYQVLQIHVEKILFGNLVTFFWSRDARRPRRCIECTAQSRVASIWPLNSIGQFSKSCRAWQDPRWPLIGCSLLSTHRQEPVLEAQNGDQLHQLIQHSRYIISQKELPIEPNTLKI